MDPVGFALEKYDAVGRWRTTDEGVPVDASGALPDGSKFEAPPELQQALLKRPELFVSTMTEKLLTYALGPGNGILRCARGAQDRRATRAAMITVFLRSSRGLSAARRFK